MAIKESATPLIAVDAVAFDLETTGLDTRSDRIIEIGAVRLGAGAIHVDDALETRVNPGVPIPPASTAIHAITDEMVAGAPAPTDAFDQLESFIAGRILIGHSIGFDLAVLKAELARIGRPFARPRSLDTRLLAELASPDLPDFSIEMLSGWLGIEVERRHSARGDALTTARIFFGLVPHLRDRGIRTVAEAEAACRELRGAAEIHISAGWETPVAEPDRARESALSRIDSYPYRHRVRAVMASPPQYAEPGDTVLESARRMATKRISSLFVADPQTGPGIVTERDILRAIAADAAGALDQPVGPIASRPLSTVRADAFVYRAIGRMDRLKVRHLGVTDESGSLIGAVSARDLLRLRASQAIRLGDLIDVAGTTAEIATAWADLPDVAEALIAEEVDPLDIAAVISRELGAVTRRVGDLAEARLRDEGLEPPDQDWALLVLGSGGRGETLLATDQDNAIVFAEGEPGGEADRYFARFGAIVADLLHEVGVPYCRGGIMARNPPWRGSLQTWRERIESWILHPTPENLLSVDIFFDLRGVRGTLDLAERLFAEAYAMASTSAAFAKQLASSSAGFRPPIGLFGRIRTDDMRVDLKANGLFPIVSLARTLCIRHNIPLRGTADRLQALQARNIGGEQDLAALQTAHRVIMGHIVAQQIEDIHQGRPPGTKVDVNGLSKDGRRRLREALAALGVVDQLTRDLLFERGRGPA